jgi:sulfatase modifying factor 1
MMGHSLHAAPPSEVANGDFIGDYQVKGVLGHGPTGTTYHVVSNVLRKEFALKAMQIHSGLSPEWLDRLEAQSSLLSNLQHQHIDTVISGGRWENLWFSVKDFAQDGEAGSCHLEQYRKRFGGTLSHYQVTQIAQQMLEALQCAANYKDAHHQGISHNNLKPQNILFAYSARPESHLTKSVPFEVRVSDFQPYKLISPELIEQSYRLRTESRSDNPRSTVRQSKLLLAIHSAYDYAAPDGASDIFSVGVLLYEALTGRLPEGRLPPIHEQRPEIPEAWTRLLAGCLSLHPANRYSNFRTMLEAINDAFPEETAPTPIVVLPEKRVERTSLTPPGMVYIPAGSFVVGSADSGDDALPQYEASTTGFYLDRYPVTNAQFSEFVRSTGYRTEAEEGEGAPIWDNGEWRIIPGVCWKNPDGRDTPPNFDAHPVTQLTYNDALAFCEWLGRRLPTEEEWEYAARGGLPDVRFPWGHTISRSQAHYNADSTAPVMSFHANGYGLYDLAGNVSEWTSSWYKAYPGNVNSNPHFGEQYRVVRGGSWMVDGSACMISYRNATEAAHCYPTVGLRTATDC